MSDFQVLLEEQLPRLLRYAAALVRDAEEAEELVADVVREALANQGECRSDLRRWLLTALHDLRGNPFRQGLAATPSRDPRAELTLSQFDRALGALPEEQRAAILLVGLEDMSYANTAAILRCQVATVRSRLARGRDNLRHAMDVTHGAARRRAA